MSRRASHICLAAAVTAMVYGPAVGQSILGGPSIGQNSSTARPTGGSATENKAAIDGSQLSHAEAVIRAMTKGYEHYIERGDFNRADNFIISLVQYIRFESAKLGMSAADLFASAQAGKSSAWSSLETLATEAAKRQGIGQGRGDNNLITDCDGDGMGPMSCITHR